VVGSAIHLQVRLLSSGRRSFFLLLALALSFLSQDIQTWHFGVHFHVLKRSIDGVSEQSELALAPVNSEFYSVIGRQKHIFLFTVIVHEHDRLSQLGSSF